MSSNGETDAQVLCWPRRVLSADDLRRHLTSQRELQLLPRTIITPLAADELHARGIRITWQPAKVAGNNEQCDAACWGYGQERPDSSVANAVKVLERDAIKLIAIELGGAMCWPRAIAEVIVRGQRPGVVAFCGDPHLVCCIANKFSGVRAAAVATPQAATRARQTLGANLLAVEMPGRTLFELRQILRNICGNGPACCPEELAKTLKELDGHAHR
jgi:hypothetical protein